MKQYIITEDQLNRLMLIAASLKEDQVMSNHIEGLCIEIGNNELNHEFPTWGRPMNAQ